MMLCRWVKFIFFSEHSSSTPLCSVYVKKRKKVPLFCPSVLVAVIFVFQYRLCTSFIRQFGNCLTGNVYCIADQVTL
jgi:hypothetical protein